MRWEKILIGGSMGLALVATDPALAVTGARQGCLGIINKTDQNLIVHVRQASRDSDDSVPKSAAVFTALRVSEDSVLSADDTDNPDASYPPRSLKADVDANYIANLRNTNMFRFFPQPQCPEAWFKYFRRPEPRP